MNSVNFDPEKFDVDEYGNLYPKEELDSDNGMRKYQDYPGPNCDSCKNSYYCWGENYESTKSDSES